MIYSASKEVTGTLTSNLSTPQMIKLDRGGSGTQIEQERLKVIRDYSQKQ
jgi:hypothetical protein